MAFGFLLHAAGNYLVTQDASKLIISFDSPSGIEPSVVADRDGRTSTRGWRDGRTSVVPDQTTVTRTVRAWL